MSAGDVMFEGKDQVSNKSEIEQRRFFGASADIRVPQLRTTSWPQRMLRDEARFLGLALRGREIRFLDPEVSESVTAFGMTAFGMCHCG